MAYEVVMPYHLHMPSYFLETFTEYPLLGYSNFKLKVYFLKMEFWHIHLLFVSLSVGRCRCRILLHVGSRCHSV